MQDKKRLIIFGGVLGVVALIALYVFFFSGGGTMSPEQAKQVEALQQAAAENAQNGPPPVKFTEPANVKPPTGSREVAP